MNRFITKFKSLPLRAKLGVISISSMVLGYLSLFLTITQETGLCSNYYCSKILHTISMNALFLFGGITLITACFFIITKKSSWIRSLIFLAFFLPLAVIAYNSAPHSYECGGFFICFWDKSIALALAFLILSIYIFAHITFELLTETWKIDWIRKIGFFFYLPICFILGASIIFTMMKLI